MVGLARTWVALVPLRLRVTRRAWLARLDALAGLRRRLRPGLAGGLVSLAGLPVGFAGLGGRWIAGSPRLALALALGLGGLGTGGRIVPPGGVGLAGGLVSRTRLVRLLRAGTGLGLTICRGFVEALGGTIRAMNRGDRPGTIFEIAFPEAVTATPYEGAPE